MDRPFVLFDDMRPGGDATDKVTDAADEVADAATGAADTVEKAVDDATP